MATRALLTVEDFLRVPDSIDGRDVRYELVEGELITVSPAMFPHNRIRDRILVSLLTFVEARRLGTVVSEQAFQLSEWTVRVPDVAFVRAGRALATERPIEGAPDLAVDVEVYVHGLAGVTRRRSDDLLEDAELLPGFSVKVSSLF